MSEGPAQLGPPPLNELSGQMPHQEYFAALLQRLDLKVRLQPQSVEYQNGEVPLGGHCHENVDRWVKDNAGTLAVRGWLIMSYGLERHSVVRNEHGVLIDITVAQPLFFLAHEGSESEFSEFANGWNQVFRDRLPIGDIDWPV